MKSVIIISIAFVLLIPSTIFAEPEIFYDTEVKYNACTERINRDVNELLKQQALSGSIIGYEGKFQEELMSNCIGNFLYPLVDAGLELRDDGRYEEAITYFDKALEIEPRLNDARMAKAGTAQLMGDHETAIELFEAVHEQNPSIDVSDYIEYSEQRLSDETVCGAGTILKDGFCVPERETMTTEMQQKSSNGGGCLIATATFGSELAPQVQQLREIRDNSLLQTESGRFFMESFNQFYYSFSPEIADFERENPVFKEVVKLAITPLLSSLSLLNYVDMDSEVEVLGYGISLILLNVGMYFVLPAVIIHRIKNFLLRILLQKYL